MSVRFLKPGTIAEIPVSALQADPHQPRKSLDEAFINTLADSLKKGAIIETPLIVRLDGKRIVLVDGEQRWRAAKLAKLKTVPCILALHLAQTYDHFDVAATQITTATMRQDLKPLDIAEFLVDLQRRGKHSMNELSAELAKRGLHEIGQAKAERYMRLVELPAWAKDLLRAGRLNESHGQAILGAIKFPEIVKAVRAQIQQNLDWKGQLTVKDVERVVEQAFRTIGIDLNRKHGAARDIRVFPIEQCRTGCPHYKKIGGAEYCLSKQEFFKKQDSALQLRAEREAEKSKSQKSSKGALTSVETDPTKVEPRKLKMSADNIVVLKRMDRSKREPLESAEFDVDGCKGCPHRQVASTDGTRDGAADYCFHPPCYDEKHRLAGKNESRRVKLRDHFEVWLRPIVYHAAPSRMTPKDVDGILLWLATGAIERYSPHYSGQMHEKAANATVGFITRNKLKDLQELMAFARERYSSEHRCVLAQDAISVMTQDQLRWFAHELKIDLDDHIRGTAYRIDEEYLRMKRKAELQALAKLAGLETVADLGVAELKAKLLDPDAVLTIGVPADIQSVYDEPFDRLADLDDDMLGIDDDDLNEPEMVCIDCGCSEMDACEGGCSWIRRDRYVAHPVGLCSACPGGKKRWDNGDRKLTEAAIAAVKARHEMLAGDLAIAEPDLVAEVAAAKPARRKRA